MTKSMKLFGKNDKMTGKASHHIILLNSFYVLNDEEHACLIMYVSSVSDPGNLKCFTTYLGIAVY